MVCWIVGWVAVLVVVAAFALVVAQKVESGFFLLFGGDPMSNADSADFWRRGTASEHTAATGTVIFIFCRQCLVLKIQNTYAQLHLPNQSTKLSVE